MIAVFCDASFVAHSQKVQVSVNNQILSQSINLAFTNPKELDWEKKNREQHKHLSLVFLLFRPYITA